MSLFVAPPVIVAQPGWLVIVRSDPQYDVPADEGRRFAIYSPEPAAEGGSYSYFGRAFHLTPAERIRP